ncbi:med7 protein, partial [Lasius niger]
AAGHDGAYHGGFILRASAGEHHRSALGGQVVNHGAESVHRPGLESPACGRLYQHKIGQVMASTEPVNVIHIRLPPGLRHLRDCRGQGQWRQNAEIIQHGVLRRAGNVDQ